MSGDAAKDEDLDADWYPAGRASGFEDEDVEQVWIGDLAVAVYKAEGRFFASQDLCTHEQAYLSDGVVVGCVIECPFHQGRFDIRTGKALAPPVVVPLQIFPVRVVNDRIFVRVTKAEQKPNG